MLNVVYRISLSKKSKRIIRKLKKKNNYKLNQDSWSKVDRKVKNEISKKLFAMNGFKCTYCERYLIGLGPQIDHFSHKASTPQFTFIPVNLFYSCSYCNSSAVKGQKTTINHLVNYYNNCTFTIVHPYYDNPDDEIFYRDEDRVFIDWNNCTQKGKNTIAFFEYDLEIMTNIRARTLVYERLNPLLSDDEKKLIQKSIAYK